MMVYGWPALQYQAWTRGTIVIHEDHPKMVALSINSALEFWLDGIGFFGGDFYDFNRAPVILSLSPGTHRLDIRVIRDVRAMGADRKPCVSITVKANISTDELLVDSEKVLLPELLDGRSLAGKVGSIPIRNQTEQWLDIVSIETQTVRLWIPRGSQFSNSCAVKHCRLSHWSLSLLVCTWTIKITGDQPLISWRYSTNPCVSYQICNCRIFSNKDDELDLVSNNS